MSNANNAVKHPPWHTAVTASKALQTACAKHGNWNC